MTINRGMQVSATGLSTERFRMDVIASNIANANTTETQTEQAYRRRLVRVSGGNEGVRIEEVMQDTRPLRRAYEPGNPVADADGYVHYSNVQPIEEMVDMLSAGRAYEANIAAFNSSKSMLQAALGIGKL
jgi:flagellar basal-body rod protein FlgC